MEICQGIAAAAELLGPGPAVAIGTFDGVHRGHQRIIQNAVEFAARQDCRAAVLTFHPHPREILTGEGPQLLTTFEQRARLIGGLGVDVLVKIPFNRDLAQVEAADFVRRYLVEQLQAAAVCVGYNFRFGHRGKGSTRTLEELAVEGGYQVFSQQPVEVNGELVSSSQIREHLASGRVARAATLLGRLYTITGTVVHGEHRGRKIGFPTANLQYDPSLQVPGSGVYACRVTSVDQEYTAVCNIGYRPTFGGSTDMAVEAHLLDFEGDLYGRTLTICFLERLRGERKFDSAEELVAQIERDIHRVRSSRDA